MTQEERKSVDEPDVLPVFPIPQTVFFPRTLLPLHIFEERYRAMVRDASNGTGLIVITRSVDDGFESLGTVGRVLELESLEDGRFNLVVEGVQRVSMTEVPCDTPYRQVRIKPRQESLGTEDSSVIEQCKIELLATLGILVAVARGEAPVVLNQELPFEVVVNKACAGLPIAAVLRQRLLAQDDLMQRQQLLSKHLDTVIESIAREGLLDQGENIAFN